MNVAQRCERATSASLPGDEWARLAADPSRGVRRAVVGNPACPAEVLASCVHDDDHDVCWTAVHHPNASAQVRRAAARSPRPFARLALAQLPDLTADLVDVLLADPDWQVREQLATCTRTPEVLEALTGDADPRVRGEVGLNDLATQAQLRRLAEDPSVEARARVAGCRRLPEDVLFRMAHDRSRRVRWWLCVTHDRHRALMKVMAADPDPMVAEHATDALSWRERLVGPVGSRVQGMLAGWFKRRIERAAGRPDE